MEENRYDSIPLVDADEEGKGEDGPDDLEGGSNNRDEDDDDEDGDGSKGGAPGSAALHKSAGARSQELAASPSSGYSNDPEGRSGGPQPGSSPGRQAFSAFWRGLHDCESLGSLLDDQGSPDLDKLSLEGDPGVKDPEKETAEKAHLISQVRKAVEARPLTLFYASPHDFALMLVWVNVETLDGPGPHETICFTLQDREFSFILRAKKKLGAFFFQVSLSSRIRCRLLCCSYVYTWGGVEKGRKRKSFLSL